MKSLQRLKVTEIVDRLLETIDVQTCSFREFWNKRDRLKINMKEFPDFTWTLKRYSNQLLSEDYNFKTHLLFVDGVVRGIATSNVVRPDWGVAEDSPINGARWLGNVEIAVHSRRRGYGTKFLGQLTKSGRWLISADKKNWNFYQNLGFVPVTVSRNGKTKAFVKGISNLNKILEDKYIHSMLES